MNTSIIAITLVALLPATCSASFQVGNALEQMESDLQAKERAENSSLGKTEKTLLENMVRRVVFSIPENSSVRLASGCKSKTVERIDRTRELLLNQLPNLDLSKSVDRKKYQELLNEVFQSDDSLAESPVVDRIRLLAISLIYHNKPKFHIPLVIARDYGLPHEELLKATNALAESAKKQRAEELSSRLGKIMGLLPEEAKMNFQSVLAVSPKFELEGISKDSTKEEIRKALILALVSFGDIASDELVDFQERAIKRISQAMSQDEEFASYQELELKVERLGEEKAQTSFAELESARDRIVSRLLEDVDREIEKELLPHQYHAIETATLYFFAKSRTPLPFRWPAVLASDFKLSAATSRSVDRIGKKMELAFNKWEQEQDQKSFDTITSACEGELKGLMILYRKIRQAEVTLDDVVPSLPVDGGARL